MKRLVAILLLVGALCCVHRASAQYYTWGSDPVGLKWSTMRSRDVRVIYPDTAANIARHTLFYIRTVQPDISYGFTHGPMRIPFVIAFTRSIIFSAAGNTRSSRNTGQPDIIRDSSSGTRAL